MSTCLHAYRLLAAALCIAMLSACATRSPHDYTAFKESHPKSILVLPPLNTSPDVAASNSMLAQATYPLAEAGYYVIPVTLAAETFKENGLTQAADVHAAPLDKLRQIFGADAALYMTVSKYGSSFQIVSSANIVTAAAKLVDLRTGKELWTGTASASSEEGQNQQQGGLAGLLVAAIVKQVISNVDSGQSHRIAGVAANRLLSPNNPNGLLYGPRSPNYGKEQK